MTAARDSNRAPHSCVVGVQWGDEGKGKLVDVLSSRADVIVRYQGGANAGHTVQIHGRKFVLHLIPCGILQEEKSCVISNGVVIDPEALVNELDMLKAAGIEREESVWISDRAHVVMPYHKAIDAAREGSSGGTKIGTTLRGIGPCYADKAARLGIRMHELVRPDLFRELLRRNLEQKNRELQAIHGAPPLDARQIAEEYQRYAERLRPRVCDAAKLLAEKDASGAVILFEGAQGTLLDVDLGTYPYVTSSNTSFLGLGAGSGFSPRRVGTVLGVTKAYATRIGEGPFPTEIDGAVGSLLREVGGEYGATTGRPRRCGWLDLVALRQSVRIGDVDALAVTKLDVLDGFDSIQVATGYRVEGREVDSLPASLDDAVEPVYRSLRGWKTTLHGARRWEDLPAAAQEYLRFIADASATPIAMISVGRERAETIELDPWLAPRGPAGSAKGVP